jgi:Viral (Superfamily 1) RNA helicase
MKRKRNTSHKKTTKVSKGASKRTRSAHSAKATWVRRYWQTFGIPDTDFEPLQRFAALADDDKVTAARRLIQESIIDATAVTDSRLPLAFEASENLLTQYSTLDDPHRSDIKHLIDDITAYLQDASRKRPLNCLMLATPGAGKSHFIKRLAARMQAQRVEAVTFNMATMQSPDDMAQPVDDLRNLKVNDKFPLLFLDEFDSDPSKYPALLPLLWEGELHIGHRDLKLGKAVIVLAGSNPDLPKLMDQSAKMQLEKDGASDGERPAGKLIDLLSRINGGIIRIPDLDLRTQRRDRRVDKVCMAVSLLRFRFGDKLMEVPRALLRFIAHTQFRYGVRSIAHLVDLIDSNALRKNALKLSSLHLPFAKESILRDSSLKLHLLDKDSAFGLVNRWKEFSKDRAVVNLRPTPYLPAIRFFRS